MDKKTRWFELSDLIPIYGLKGIDRVMSTRNQYEGVEFELKIRKDLAYTLTSIAYHIVIPIKISIALAQQYELCDKAKTIIENYL